MTPPQWHDPPPVSPMYIAALTADAAAAKFRKLYPGHRVLSIRAVSPPHDLDRRVNYELRIERVLEDPARRWLTPSNRPA